LNCESNPKIIHRAIFIFGYGETMFLYYAYLFISLTFIRYKSFKGMKRFNTYW